MISKKIMKKNLTHTEWTNRALICELLGRTAVSTTTHRELSGDQKWKLSFLIF